MIERQNILKGDYADPSIIRVNEDYYMVTSPFVYAPSFIIWHSTDLLHWEKLCNAVEEYVGDVWAIDLVYYDNHFYMYYKCNKTNWVIHSDCIMGPWSKPIDLQVSVRIDPGHISDEEGNRYLYFNHGYMIQLSKDGLSVQGELKKVYDGWPIPEDWEVEGMCLEGPKLIKKNGYYYLVVAQGGTAGPATSHMVVVARSKSIEGPFENAPNNPIIHTESKEDMWWSKGHGTLIDSKDGRWYMVYHAYEKDYRTLGRQILISEVVWTEDDWLYVKPIEKATDNVEEEVIENYNLTDNFKNTSLSMNWSFFRTNDRERLNCTKEGLFFEAKGDSLVNSSPLLCMPFSHDYEAKVCIELEDEDTVAGLTCFYNEYAHCYLGVSQRRMEFGKMQKPRHNDWDTECRKIYIKVINKDQFATFFYSFDNEIFQKVINFDISGYHHNTFSEFLSVRLGIYCYGKGKAKFTNFEYKHMN